MAEIDPTELVTVRNPDTGEEREIPRGAVPYFPAYVLLKKQRLREPQPRYPEGLTDG
jgi:nucleoid DNA-binding protein